MYRAFPEMDGSGKEDKELMNRRGCSNRNEKERPRIKEPWYYDLFNSGMPRHQRAQQGVAILICKELRKNVKNWEAINSRMIRMNLTMHCHWVLVLGVYGVNDDATFAVKDQSLEKLDERVAKVGPGREALPLGDLNGRTGSRVDSKIVSPFGEVTVNDKGSRIIDVCEQRKWEELDGFYQHKDIHKYTWVQPTRGLRTLIDCVLVKRVTYLKIQQVRLYRGLFCGRPLFPQSGCSFSPSGVLKRSKLPSATVATNACNKWSVKNNINSLQHPSAKALLT